MNERYRDVEYNLRQRIWQFEHIDDDWSGVAEYCCRLSNRRLIMNVGRSYTENRSHCFSSHRGFTLIELLVVIAIISLLVSILVPSLQKAKELAKNTICLSNLRNIGVGMAVYTHENDMWFPNVGNAPFLGVISNYGLLPNLQVALEQTLPRTETFTCVNRPFAPGETPGANLPWKRSPAWQCPNDEYNSDYYKYFGSSYQYISFPGYPFVYALAGHQVIEVGDAAGAIMIQGAANAYGYYPHNDGNSLNGVCIDGHAQDVLAGDVGYWNFQTNVVD